MSEELMIKQQDLIDWIDRPPSNDDLDLATFISTKLEKFYELEQKLQQKENIIKEVREYITRKDICIDTRKTDGSMDYVDLEKELLEILDKGD